MIHSVTSAEAWTEKKTACPLAPASQVTPVTLPAALPSWDKQSTRPAPATPHWFVQTKSTRWPLRPTAQPACQHTHRWDSV